MSKIYSSKSAAQGSTTSVRGVSNLSITWTEDGGTANVTWKWQRNHTDHYVLRWDYMNENGTWVLGDEQDFEPSPMKTTGNVILDTYSADSDTMLQVRVYVKPVASSHDVKYYTNKKKTKTKTVSVKWWTAASATKTKALPASAPEAPSVSAEWDSASQRVRVEVGFDEECKYYLYRFKNGAWTNIDVSIGSAVTVGNYQTGSTAAMAWDESKVEVYDTYALGLADGNAYKYVVRGYTTSSSGGKVWGEWSDIVPDGDPVVLPPEVPTGLGLSCSGWSDDAGAYSVELSWESGSAYAYNGEAYEVRLAVGEDAGEHIAEDDYSGILVEAQPDPETAHSYTNTGDVEDAGTLWATVRATTDAGDSDWAEPVSIEVGAAPAAPTVADLPLFAELGSTVDVEWTYNASDGSAQGAWQVWLGAAPDSGEFGTADGVEAEGDGDECTGGETGLSGDAEWALVAWGEDASTFLAYDSSDAGADGYLTTQEQLENAGSAACWASHVYAAEDGDDNVSFAFAVRVKSETWDEWSAFGQSAEFHVLDAESLNVEAPSVFSELPVAMTLAAKPYQPRKWTLLVEAAESYETTDVDGDDTLVPEGADIWEWSEAETGDADVSSGTWAVGAECAADEASWTAGPTYRWTATATTVYGTVAETEGEFTCEWSGEGPEPELQAVFDEDSLEAHLWPACYNVYSLADGAVEAAAWSSSSGVSVVLTAVETVEAADGGEASVTAELTLSFGSDGVLSVESATVSAEWAGLSGSAEYADGEAEAGAVVSEIDGEAVTAIADAGETSAGDAISVVGEGQGRSTYAAAGLAAESSDGAVSSDDVMGYFLRDDIDELEVWRRDPNGELLLMADALENSGQVEVVDSYPYFGETTYRVAARTTGGLVGYTDTVLSTEHDAIVIQYASDINTYGGGDEGVQSDDGFIEIPYNISIDETYEPDVSLVEYIGNSEPTAYFGTQRGASVSSAGSYIRVTDADEIQKLRNFAGALKPAYYRDPSGLGFWAQVGVAFSTSYDTREVVADLSVTRILGDYTATTTDAKEA